MTIRSTLFDLIQQVRALTATNVNEYVLGSQSYWSNDQIGAVLDKYRLDFSADRLTPLPETNSGGTVVYYVHQAHFTNLESTAGGTAVLYVYDGTGARVGTANYTIDYNAGRVTFNANTGGEAYYLTGRSYDLYAAAADIWEMKAAHVAERFDFTADGASFKASQLITQYTAQAQRCRAKSRTGGVTTGTLYRSDVNVAPPYGGRFADVDAD